ncbi:ubiquinone biosynthesis protein UbiB [Candidatus Photodesmus blepharus]|uniref:Probable protein kinase UbiB n=1 Tax=Candidatus Photodesmus blepharonis TaxID=1179155 RepID=A0A084CNS0_9GAMM|nr:ubiquinone biosynthesis regulatory protein kinase UbiB [Candidatus Photodesmus blepharus]KEY91449.1 ubiquinone biosynthesis protein UbiB [Candidatus Photodesmus blepharus]
MIPTELKRFYYIIKIHLEYGLDELLSKHQCTRILLVRRALFWVQNQHSDKSLGDRLYLALQELGPVWIKFGQMISTRRDLFPAHIVDPLSQLQDKVLPFDGFIAKKQIEQALGGSLENWFSHFDVTPLASASISQVHTAQLKESNREVVLKVIRPNVRSIIDSDLKLMRCIAKIVQKAQPNKVHRLRLLEVFCEYEKVLLNELDLRREAANTMRLRRNFKNSAELYIPEVILKHSNETVMVSERVHGIHVSDIKKIKKNGTNMQLLAERGVHIFFTQVFRDNFFHADMHSGNILVDTTNPDNPKWIGLDCGIVGTLNNDDKRYLAETLLAFFNRDYHQVAQLHIDSGWVPYQTDVDEFEFAIQIVCEPIFAKPLCEISFAYVLLSLFSIARRFNMEVQPQLILLQKTLLYVEGLGHQLCPQLNLWKTAKPFLEKWMKEQTGAQAIINAVKDQAPFLAKQLPQLPQLLFISLKQIKEINQRIDQLCQNYRQSKRRRTTGKFLFGTGAILVICSILLMNNSYEEQLSILSGVVGVTFWLLSWRIYRQ